MILSLLRNLIIKYYYEGWPKSKNDLEPDVTPFFNLRHELHCVNDILFKNEQVMISKAMQNEIVDSSQRLFRV